MTGAVFSRRGAGLLGGPLLAGLILALPFPSLTPQAHTLAALLALCVVFWTTEAIPLPATAMLAPALAVALGVAPAKEAFAPFGDPLLFLFVGSFLLAAAMSHHGLDRRIACGLMSRRAAGGSRLRLLASFTLLSVAVSMWISNAATTAMILPIALGVLRSLPRETPGGVDPFDTALVLCVAFGASVGGIGTPVGTPPNLIGIGMIDTLAGVKIGFFEWMGLAVPILAVLVPLLIGLLYLLFPSRLATGPAAVERLRESLAAERARLGPVSRGEIAVAAAFFLAVALWIIPGVAALVAGADHPVAALLARRLPEGPAGLLAACLLFFIPVDWKRGEFALDWDVAARIDWGTIALFGGGLAMGSLMFSTGLAEALGRSLTGSGGFGAAGFLGVAIASGILVSEATSNTASASMVIPVVIALAREQGLDPVLPAIGACLGCSFGFALPVSTAPNALAYGTGLAPIGRMMRAGLLLDAIGFVTIWAGLLLLRG